MKKLLNNKFLLIGFTLLAGVFLGWLLKPSGDESAHQHINTSDNQIWTCSMHPQIRQNEPGDCPICGMELIPLEDNEADVDPMAVNMSPTAMQLASVSTAIVGQMDPVKKISLNGKVQENERLLFTQPAHVGGRVERLAVDFTGQYVKKGQPLAYLYSPELVTAQEELFEAYKIRESQPRLYEAARNKLRNWKLTPDQVNQILASGTVKAEFPVLADVSGYVTDKLVSLGDYVQQGAPIYQIADLSNVWVLFDVYETDVPWVNEGDDITFTVRSIPGKVFEGQISFIDPVIDPQTRVAQARVEMKNPKNQLKPEMFASGVVQSTLENRENALVIPKSAVMWTGKRSVVYVKAHSAVGVDFVMQEVLLGPALGESYVVEEGLEEGDEIAVSGTFSIDAAAQLAGKPSMMNRAGDPAVTDHHAHGRMNTSVEQPLEISDLTISKEASKALHPVLKRYLELKNALVADDLKAAIKTSKAMRSALNEVKMSFFEGEAHVLWMNHSGRLQKLITAITAAGSLEDARASFIALSEQMILLVETFDFHEETLYVQHCPMADDYAGADWLSEEEEIRNPYFGESMLTCGEVKDVVR